MSGESPALVRSFPVGARTVTMTVPLPARGKLACFVVEWAPDMPTRLSRRERRAYRSGRAAVTRELGKLLGGAVLTVEI